MRLEGFPRLKYILRLSKASNVVKNSTHFKTPDVLTRLMSFLTAEAKTFNWKANVHKPHARLLPWKNTWTIKVNLWTSRNPQVSLDMNEILRLSITIHDGLHSHAKHEDMWSRVLAIGLNTSHLPDWWLWIRRNRADYQYAGEVLIHLRIASEKDEMMPLSASMDIGYLTMESNQLCPGAISPILHLHTAFGALTL